MPAPREAVFEEAPLGAAGGCGATVQALWLSRKGQLEAIWWSSGRRSLGPLATPETQGPVCPGFSYQRLKHPPADEGLRAGEWPDTHHSLSLQGHEDPLGEQGSPRCDSGQGSLQVSVHASGLPCAPLPPGSRTGLEETLSSLAWRKCSFPTDGWIDALSPQGCSCLQCPGPWSSALCLHTSCNGEITTPCISLLELLSLSTIH